MGRVALITGGVRGIGRAVGLRLAAGGWSVAVCHRGADEDAARTAEDLAVHPARSLAVRCDVSDPAACADLVDRVSDELGGIDALVNGAGPYHRIPLLEETVEGWNEMFDNNLHPVFYLARLVAPGMIERGFGRIVSFAMANADRMSAQPFVAGHYIAKAGVLMLTRSLARVLGPHGITVNAVSPGFIDSGSAPPEELEAMAGKIPAGYIGEVDDTVAATLFFLSDEARYVNGGNLHVSGGWGI
ncbi:MAG: 3-oxoacyl-ACP reductase [Planctomycetes bacterium]|jgi:3-oxoacyl-[acyl-carrier protein] reductase|nr:3-oxoacyl-ACP reductase [Planctomycetota bacterium]MDP6408288.1 SDR family oxidoreductase [Planctomycetota bacterium]